LWLILHVNHPREINRDSLIAIKALREAGCTIVSQTVLLRGVNDCEYILGRLFEGLVRAGVKPYYLFQLDEVMGAGHFKVRIETGIAIMRKLRANLSGLCIPQYAVDITGGLGKVPIDYRYLRQKKGRRRHFENLNGEKGVYADSGKESRCLSCGICTMKSFPAT
jgi:lysine 2,3-aminomutase